MDLHDSIEQIGRHQELCVDWNVVVFITIPRQRAPQRRGEAVGSRRIPDRPSSWRPVPDGFMKQARKPTLLSLDICLQRWPRYETANIVMSSL